MCLAVTCSGSGARHERLERAGESIRSGSLSNAASAGAGNGTTRASALLCVFRGQAFRQQGFHDAAHETLKEALRSKSRAAPIRHMALAERAQNYFAQGKKGMVRKDLERILAEDSDYSNVRERLSQLDPDTANARRGSSLLPLCGGPLLYPGFTIRLL
jgi:tetratricopeptide (TPR) repeat protein